MTKTEQYIIMRIQMLQDELKKNPSEENTLVINHSIGEMTMILQMLKKENK